MYKSSQKDKNNNNKINKTIKSKLKLQNSHLIKSYHIKIVNFTNYRYLLRLHRLKNT